MQYTASILRLSLNVKRMNESDWTTTILARGAVAATGGLAGASAVAAHAGADAAAAATATRSGGGGGGGGGTSDGGGTGGGDTDGEYERRVAAYF